jgi:hypothetical protein
MRGKLVIRHPMGKIRFESPLFTGFSKTDSKPEALNAARSARGLREESAVVWQQNPKPKNA